MNKKFIKIKILFILNGIIYFYDIINVFVVTFDQFNASLLHWKKKYYIFFKASGCNQLILATFK